MIHAPSEYFRIVLFGSTSRGLRERLAYTEMSFRESKLIGFDTVNGLDLVESSVKGADSFEVIRLDDRSV